jgi:hypothetical protein
MFPGANGERRDSLPVAFEDRVGDRGCNEAVRALTTRTQGSDAWIVDDLRPLRRTMPSD